jgi:hypothetical protein
MTTKSDLSPHAQLYIGLLIVAATTLGQAVILFNNASFALHNFGWAFLMIYLSAATCYIVLPWVSHHIEDFAHLGLTKATLLGFCFWLTFEEHVHAAQGFKAPEGLAAIASMVLNHDSAKLISLGLVVAALLAVVEVLYHFQSHGVTIVREARKRIK